mgnify:CR=1 FL=1
MTEPLPLNLKTTLKVGLPWVLVGMLAVSLMPSGQSLGMDEGTSASYAAEKSLLDISERLFNSQTSEAQLPLGIFSIWAGSNVFGHSEFGLRFSSAIWIAVAVFFLWRTGVRARVPILPALFVCNAFVWYYAGEARPYAMQIALGSVLLYGFVMAVDEERDVTRGLRTTLIVGPFLCATSMLAVIPYFLVMAVVFSLLITRGWKPRSCDWLWLLMTCASLPALGSYYAWTLAQGKGGGTAQVWGAGLKNLLFAGYEMLGYSGFGPGRFELRQLGLTGGIEGVLAGFSGPAVVGIVVLGCLYLWAGRNLLRPRKSDTRIRLAVLAGLVTLASCGGMLILALMKGFPFWGRHLSPVFPFLMLVIAIAASVRGADQRKRDFALPLCLGLTLLISSLLVRFDPAHSRDDYRAAARLALSAMRSGESVWWSAGGPAAQYYGVVFCETNRPTGTPCVFPAFDSAATELLPLRKPDLVIVSRPDLFDRAGALQQHLKENRYEVTIRLKAFQIYQQPREGHNE